MSKSYIAQELRRLVAEDARDRCGYCLTSQRIIGQPMTLDHLLPEVKGGKTERENLWLACRRCNEFKGARTDSIDPVTNTTVPLFNPRFQSWNVHFTWASRGIEIVGLTAIGRATVLALRLNNEEIVGARSLWIQAGWHPPQN